MASLSPPQPRPAHAGPTRQSVLMGLVAELERRAIPYALVGDTRGFPETIQSDVDFVVAESFLPAIGSILKRFCDEHKLRLVQLLQHEQTAWYYAVAWRGDDGAFSYLNPDFCGDFFHLGRRFLGVEEMLAKRIRAVGSSGVEKGFWVLEPGCEFIYYLLKKVDKYELEPRHGDHLSAQWRLDPESALSEIRRFWPQVEAELLAEAARTNDWSRAKASLGSLQKALRSGLSFSAKRTWLEWRRKYRRLIQPTGVMVAVFGPDGSGKSSVIKGVANSLAPAFRRTYRVHLRPKLGSDNSQNDAPETNPHGKSPRPWPMSLLKLAYWWFDYSLGYFVKIRPRLARSTLVLFDRYFQDILVDGRRYRFAGPSGLARVLSRLGPQPDVFILLDAPVEILLKRKQEVAPNEIQRQREAYRREFERLPNSVVVDASRSLPEVATDVEDAILKFMARRLERRMAPGIQNAPWAALFQNPGADIDTGQTIVSEMRALSKHKQAFLLLPNQPKLALQALALYSAQTRAARAFTSALRVSLKAGLNFVLPSRRLEFSTKDPLAKFMSEVSGRPVRDLRFAVMAGNPAVEGRRFIILTFDSGDRPAAVVKAGLGDSARELIRKEREFLSAVPAETPGVPKILGSLTTERVEALALPFLDGCSPDAHDTTGVAACLSAWLDHTRETMLRDLAPWPRLRDAAGKSQLYCKLAAQLEERRVKPAVFHGDFAPWNLRVMNRAGPGQASSLSPLGTSRQGNCQWMALDWERGQTQGIPGWDWFHYVVQCAVLVERLPVPQLADRLIATIESPAFRKYAESCGILDIEQPLTLAYLLYIVEVIKPTEGLCLIEALLQELSGRWGPGMLPLTT